jgi:hypothetical protein
MITKLQREFGPQDIQAVGVVFNDATGSIVIQFIKEFGIGYAKRDSVGAWSK